MNRNSGRCLAGKGCGEQVTGRPESGSFILMNILDGSSRSVPGARALGSGSAKQGLSRGRPWQLQAGTLGEKAQQDHTEDCLHLQGGSRAL